MTALVLETPEVDLVYDIHGPWPPATRPLLMIGQPMDAGGFTVLAGLFPDRTVITYDPRGLGRSTRKDGRVDNDPRIQAVDVHTLIDALGAGPVDMFASSGGAVTALALVTAYPHDIHTLVAHEPPLLGLLLDAAAAARAREAVRDVYAEHGWGAGMAAFLDMTSWQGEFTGAYFARPAPDPAAYGLPVEDDGSRDDPLLSERSWAVSDFQPDDEALRRAPTRLVVGAGEESRGVLTGRTAAAVAALVGQEVTAFPGDHGGFVGGEFGYAGAPERFAPVLRAALA